MRTYRIIPLPLLRLDLDKGYMTYLYNHGTTCSTVTYCWYIDGADQNILVDTGADAEVARSWRGLPAETIMTFEDALASLKLKPSDIDIVIQTHLHWDHCCNTHKCQNAKVLVQEEELKFARSPHPIMVGYPWHLLKNLNFVPLNGQYEVAPGIELIPTPGHTVGTQSVCINTERGRAVLTGFCCLKDNFEPPEELKKKKLTVIAPGIHLNAIDAFESALRVKELADILIPIHAPPYEGVKSIP